ncbi:MAG: hypothetical protein JW810_12510 [Sedimentisphaerales bacterium]|nr:hypothetical protein [Sedimentisphaerales bacterium]
MEQVTLLFALLASALALYLSLPLALAVYLTVLFTYPTYLVVQLGTLDVSAGRIVIGVLLLRCLLTPGLLKSFRWTRMDQWMVFFAFVFFLVPILSWRLPMMQILENRSGQMMDVFFTYMVARLCIQNRQDMVSLCKWLAVMIVPLAILGVIETLTGWQPFVAFKRFCPWAPVEHYEKNIRLGLIRAVGPFEHPITFGAFFFMLFPFIYWLRHQTGPWRKWAYVSAGFALAGAISSMSSGPWMMMVFLFGCLFLERRRHWIKPILYFMLFSVMFVSIASNRPFYHVICSYANPVQGTGWHRGKLIDCAIRDVGQWWLAGYRGLDPGWGPNDLGMTWTDVTNAYISEAVRFGMLGVISFAGILIIALVQMIQRHRQETDPPLKSFYWMMASLLVALMVAFNSCSFFGQARSIFYGVLGLIASSIGFAVRQPLYRIQTADHLLAETRLC